MRYRYNNNNGPSETIYATRVVEREFEQECFLRNVAIKRKWKIKFLSGLKKFGGGGLAMHQNIADFSLTVLSFSHIKAYFLSLFRTLYDERGQEGTAFILHQIYS